MFRNGRPNSRVSMQAMKNSSSLVVSSMEFDKNDVNNNNKGNNLSREDLGKLIVPKQSKDEHLNFHYIGEEDEEEKESRSFMLEEDEDMEVLSVNDQQQSLKELSSTSGSRNSMNSAKSNNNNYETTLSRDSLPLKQQRERDNNLRESRDSISSHRSSGGRSVYSSQESNHSYREPTPQYVERPVSTSSRPARIAEYIKRFRTAPPTKRGDRKGLDELQDIRASKTINILDQILPSRREKFQSQQVLMEDKIDPKKSIEKFDYIDAIDFDINEIGNLTRMALDKGDYDGIGNIDSILSKSISKSEVSTSDDDLDEMFRQSVLSRLQSIGLHESYLDPNNYEIMEEEKEIEEYDAVSKVEELIKERNLVEQHMLSRDRTISSTKPEQPKPQNSSIVKDKQISVSQSLESLKELPFEETLQFVDEEELIKNQLGIQEKSLQSSSDHISEEIDINDDDNELFKNDFICQSLKLKITKLRQQLTELENNFALLE